MFKNYLIVAIRNLMRNKIYATLNVLGLGIGMACCLLIVLFVQHELRYDRVHKKGDRIYKVVRETQGKDGSRGFDWGTSGPLGPALARDYSRGASGGSHVALECESRTPESSDSGAVQSRGQTCV